MRMGETEKEEREKKECERQIARRRMRKETLIGD